MLSCRWRRWTVLSGYESARDLVVDVRLWLNMAMGRRGCGSCRACSVNLGGRDTSLYSAAYLGRGCCIGIDSGLRRFMKDLGAGFSIRRFW